MNPSNYVFTIKGKIKPYVRMTQRGKYVKPEALEYQASQIDIEYQVKEQMAAAGLDPFEKGVKLVFTAIITRTQEKGDGDNIIKALLDACNGILYHDDAQFRKYDVFIADNKDLLPKTRFNVRPVLGGELIYQMEKMEQLDGNDFE